MLTQKVLCSGSVREGDVSPAAEGGGTGDQTERHPDGPTGESPAAQRAGQSSNSHVIIVHLTTLTPQLRVIMFIWSAAGEKHKVQQPAEGSVCGELSADEGSAGH